MKSNTKNAKGSGTIRKRSDGRWEARYTTGIDPKTGKQTQKSVYGKTQKEVRQKLTEATAEIDSGTYLEQTKDTVGEWLDTWLKTYALYSVKSYTYDAYERSCNIHIKPALGRIRLSALTAPQIQQFYNSLITEKELSPKTVKKHPRRAAPGAGTGREAGNAPLQSDECLRFTKGPPKRNQADGAGGDHKISASDPRYEVWAGVSNHPVHRAAGGGSAGTDVGLH